MKVGDLVKRFADFRFADLGIGIVVHIENRSMFDHQTGGFPRSRDIIHVMWPEVGLGYESAIRLELVHKELPKKVKKQQ